MMKTSIRLIAMFAAFLPMLALAGPVNVNTADAATIAAELKGVGLSKAKAIVEYRKKHGPFRSAEDLTLVKGIGERTLDLNKSDIKVTSDKKK
jgi:competence protein ComEA